MVTGSIGHLRAGVTPASATSDLNAIATSLAKSYPKSDDGLSFVLSHPGLAGNSLGKPTRGIYGRSSCSWLVSFCWPRAPNLGSLFCRAGSGPIARKSRSAWRLDLAAHSSSASSSPKPFWFRSLEASAVWRQAVGILRMLSVWRPIPNIPINVPVNPDATTYLLALLLAIFSGLLFGLIPVSQVLRSDPWQGHPLRQYQCRAGCAALRCGMCCSGCRSPSALFW